MDQGAPAVADAKHDATDQIRVHASGIFPVTKQPAWSLATRQNFCFANAKIIVMGKKHFEIN
uniref:Uncharacterized protein n=1 Tax=Triticum urartu TaxID=4572 RepID=A0A8R7PEX0_TRIUA